MKFNFHKSFWEAECNTLDDLNKLLVKIKTEGYQGSELFLSFPKELEDLTELSV